MLVLHRQKGKLKPPLKWTVTKNGPIEKYLGWSFPQPNPGCDCVCEASRFDGRSGGWWFWCFLGFLGNFRFALPLLLRFFPGPESTQGLDWTELETRFAHQNYQIGRILMCLNTTTAAAAAVWLGKRSAARFIRILLLWPGIHLFICTHWTSALHRKTAINFMRNYFRLKTNKSSKWNMWQILMLPNVGVVFAHVFLSPSSFGCPN